MQAGNAAWAFGSKYQQQQLQPNPLQCLFGLEMDLAKSMVYSALERTNERQDNQPRGANCRGYCTWILSGHLGAHYTHKCCHHPDRWTNLPIEKKIHFPIILHPIPARIPEKPARQARGAETGLQAEAVNTTKNSRVTLNSPVAPPYGSRNLT